MNTVTGLQVIRPPSSSNENLSYRKTFDRVLRLLRKTVFTARRSFLRADVYGQLSFILVYLLEQ